MEFDVSVLGIVSQIMRTHIRVLDEQQSISSDEDMDEKIDEMNRKSLRAELESWRIERDDKETKDSNKKAEDEEDIEDNERQRRYEIMQKAEKAIFNKHIGIVKSKNEAMSLGVGRSRREKSLWIPLSLCVNCIAQNLQNECGLESTDEFGRSALFYAVRSGDVQVFDMIIKYLRDHIFMRFDRRLSKERSDSTQNSAHFKSYFAQILNKSDVDGMTPILVAISCGHFAVTRKLLSMGADARVRNGSGRTAILIACETNRLNIVNELLHWYTKSSSESVSSSRRIKELMNERLCNGTTPLLWAAENANEDTLRLFLELGADVQASSTSGGLTAIHIAALSANLDMIRTLLYFGANPLQCNASGEDVASIARHSKGPLGKNVSRWLERWSDVVPKDLARKLLRRSRAGTTDPKSIQSAIREDLKARDQIDVWNSFLKNRLVQWTVECAVKTRYTYVSSQNRLDGDDKKYILCLLLLSLSFSHFSFHTQYAIPHPSVSHSHSHQIRKDTRDAYFSVLHQSRDGYKICRVFTNRHDGRGNMGLVMLLIDSR